MGNTKRNKRERCITLSSSILYENVINTNVAILETLIYLTSHKNFGKLQMLWKLNSNAKIKSNFNDVVVLVLCYVGNF